MRWKLVLLACFLIALTVIGERGAYRLYQLKKIAQKMKNENHLLQKENESLIKEIENLQEADYLERLIREQWGYLREGETLLEIPGNSP
ncbi:MAG: septum formation initiator family protein [Deltaproteobacteria bacterium]|nr:septum formation initiator family protein [Deltaproteobacteria bacterium]